MTTTTNMRALILDNYDGSPFRDARIDLAPPKPGHVQVKIHASGVNPIDYKIRTGQAPYAMPELPAVLGTDMAGEIVAIGPSVSAFAVGDHVYGLTGGVRGLQGSLAEYANVDAALLAPKPKNLSMREAAAIPLVALTAWEGLVDRANVQPGQKVLVQGGSGGVGHLAVQIAKALGAEVFATACTEKLEMVRELGATAIDYTKVGIEQYVQDYTGGEGFDIVYDTVGGPTLEASLGATRHYGRIVSCAAFGPHNLAMSSLRSADISGVFVLHPMLSGERRAHHGDILRRVAELIEAGKVRPVLDARHFTLDTAMAAHDAVEQGANVKVVIDVIAS
ncbi:zinc-dependent alcohol dehydrogenase family protein [Cupriavidus metallidurans]|uniref:zinc-dependent alcohol dehydrogenase family protein n=1 Tax=Cupriavidus metallidurans TaxID=119219 RepID=UPI000568EB41|nr:zinc-dependent alcohol dehydrogenase family protein [Cupriavidus metallidurans]